VHGVKFDVKHDNVLAKAMVAQIPERQPKIVLPPEAAMVKMPAWNTR
jgi:hypothetical protein